VGWDDAKKASLMQDAGVVRNRAKIEATPALARVWLDLMGAGGFARHLWGFVDGRPIESARKTLADVPAETDAARAMSKDLKARGANFVGPTIVYAFMQATGMVNDHLVTCWRCAECRKLARDNPFGKAAR
jgi:DNA-3-methyladenine glycosylase I